MSHAATSGSVRIAGVLILVWIGAYWMRTPGGDAAPFDLPAIPQPSAALGVVAEVPAFDPELSGLLPHERDVLVAPDTGGPPSVDPTPRTDPEPAGPMRTYTVLQDDTLGGIAFREYGSITYANLIFEANRDQLDSMHDLDLGMVLRLPPKP